MERLTKRNESGQAYYKKCFEEPCNGMGERDCDTCEHSYAACERLADYEDLEIVAEQVRDLDKICTQTMQELGKYKKLEERLNSLFNGQLTLEDIVNGLERTLIEPNSPHPVNAKVLTHAEAAEWDEYQRLKEQGMIPPCNVGDTVWFIGSKCDKCEKDDCYGCPYNLNGDKRNERFLYEMTVEQFRVRNSTIYLVDTDAIYASNEISFNVNQLGKTVFLTKEAAEQALKEMEMSNE